MNSKLCPVPTVARVLGIYWRVWWNSQEFQITEVCQEEERNCGDMPMVENPEIHDIMPLFYDASLRTCAVSANTL